MSDGFPSGSCADAILSRGEAVEAAGRFLVSVLVFCRDRKTDEVRTRCVRGSRALWIVMRAGRCNPKMIIFAFTTIEMSSSLRDVGPHKEARWSARTGSLCL